MHPMTTIRSVLLYRIAFLALVSTVFPAPINLAATWNPNIARQTGAAIASEARATGVDMILAPVLDVARDLAGAASRKTLEKTLI